jgi:hypothetical protein
MSVIETVTEKTVDYKARARRAWETRRANAAGKKKVAAPKPVTAKVVKARRGRPVKAAVSGISFGGFEVTSAVYTYDQVKEIGAAAVTTDGSSYRLLRRDGALVLASFFEK